MKIGIAGVGRMGAACTERLIKQGHEVGVWNRTSAKTESLATLGAHVFDSPAELAAASDTVLTILTNADAIESVYHGDSGLLEADINGKLIIDMSTVQPTTIQTLSAHVQKRNAAFVECPVGGTVAPALGGKLIGLAGGESADVMRAKPVLDDLCRRIEHVGPIGSGAKMKLAINLPLAVYWQALGEALSLCRDLAIKPEDLVDLFADTSAGPNVLKNRAQVVAQALGGQQVPGTFDIDGLRKDLNTMLAEASDNGLELPVTKATLTCYDSGAQAGLGQFDGAQQTAYWRNRNDT